MKAGRLVHRLAIAARRPSAVGYATAADLDLVADAAEPAGAELPLIHALDLLRERALFTLHTAEGLQKALESPFLYASALDHATAISSVPFERLRGPYPSVADATLLFSIGRTGSTLLVRLLRAAGCHAASEPDWFTGLCRLTQDEAVLLGPAMRRTLVRAGVASLAAALGPQLFIKLRSQCNAAPEVLMEALPGARAVLMLRGKSQWAMSRWRAFGEPPEQIADMLREGITAFDRLTERGIAPRVLWFEDVLANAALAIAGIVPGLVMDDAYLARIAAVMQRDSQAGTVLARATLAPVADEAAFTQVFEREWRALRGRAACSPQARRLLEQVEAG